MDCIVIRRAELSDRPNLLNAVAELQNYERELHETRLPGEQIAEAYTRWMLSGAEGSGLVLLAENADEFVGFAAAWIEQVENVAETSDSNRFGFISDICILSKYRGSESQTSFLKQSSRTLIRLASRASGSGCWRQTDLRGWLTNARVSRHMK